MKKLLALFLCCLILLPMIVACQDNNKPSDETTAGVESQDPSETADPYKTGVPENLDYQEREFVIAAPETWGNTYFDRDEMTDEPINDSIFTRNRTLEARFNITIRSMNLGYTHEQAAKFQTFSVSGEDVIDMIGVATYQSGKPMITSGLAKPWNDVPYININQKWWNKSVTETLSVLDNYYYLSGDINYAYMSNIMCCFFNKEVAEKYAEAVGDLYQTVKDKKWTYDTFNNIIKVITDDSTGDGKMDENDTYGHLQYYHSMEAWVYGANYQTVVMGNDGAHMNFYTNKMQNIVNQVYNMIFVNKDSYLSGQDGNTGKLTTIFFDNRALFLTTTLGSANGYRNYETDFGILPNPMYDDQQKNYYTYSDQWGLVCCLPSTATNYERTGAIIEEMCALSMKLIRPAYYDKTLIGKGIRDDESEEMLDIIFAGVLYDTGITFCSDLSYIPLRSLISSQSNGLSSWWRKNEKKITSNFTELFEYVQGVKDGSIT